MSEPLFTQQDVSWLTAFADHEAWVVTVETGQLSAYTPGSEKYKARMRQIENAKNREKFFRSLVERITLSLDTARVMP